MKHLSLVLFSIFLTACSTPQALNRSGYVWPPAPDIARIEWVNSYASQYDFSQTSWDTLRRKLAGKEPALTFAKPWGIASNGEGKVYVSDTQAGVVLVYDFEARKVEPLGAGILRAPMGVALDSDGNVYISDPAVNKVYAFTTDGKPLKTVGDDETLNWPVGIAVDSIRNRLYVISAKSHNISVFDPETGTHIATWGKRGSGDGEFNFPTDVDIDSKGNIVVADSMNARVQILDPDGKFIRKFGQRGDGPADFRMIKGIAVDRHTDNIYVTDGQGDKEMVYSPTGEPLMTLGRTHSADITAVGAGGFLIPQDISVDKNGRIYVVDSMNRRFQVFQIVDEEWLKERVRRAEFKK